MDLIPYGDDPKDLPQISLASRQARDQDAQQDHRHPRAQGPWLGWRDRGLEEHEPRHGQQRRPLAQQLLYQRLQPIHPPGGHPPDHPPEVRPATAWTAFALASITAGRSRRRNAANGPGRTTQDSVCDRSGSAGPRRVASSIPSASASSRSYPRLQRQAWWRSWDPLNNEGFDAAPNPSTSCCWRAQHWGWATRLQIAQRAPVLDPAPGLERLSRAGTGLEVGNRAGAVREGPGDGDGPTTTTAGAMGELPSRGAALFVERRGTTTRRDAFAFVG